MKRNKELKAIFPNKIPISLIEACKTKAESQNKSLNEWLQDLLRSVVGNKRI
jgi:predicted HicB family RNase H-like nuclease